MTAAVTEDNQSHGARGSRAVYNPRASRPRPHEQIPRKQFLLQ